MEQAYILAIHPGFQDTKISVYQNSGMIFLKSIRHNPDMMKSFVRTADQLDYRVNAITEELSKAGIENEKIRIIIARGGLVKPMKSGVYNINETLLNDLRNSPFGDHAVNLGGLIAQKMKEIFKNAQSYVVDPVVVDELIEVARITGLPEVKRKSVFHALEHRSVARKHAASVMKRYEDLNLIVAYAGEGVSIAAHQRGRVIDVNQAFDGEGPFSLVRAGSLPAGELVRLCFSGKYSEQEILNLLQRDGGMKAYFNTSDPNELERRFEQGDKHVRLVFEAMAYNVAKYIGSLSPALKGKVDAILLTGMVAFSRVFVDYVSERVNHIAQIFVYPGETVLDALAYNGGMLLKEDAEVFDYE